MGVIGMLASAYVDWKAMGEIVLIGLVGGAGLVGVFSVGLVALSHSGYTDSPQARRTR